MAAMSMMVLIYSGAIALDLTNVYLVKSEDQRIADQSAIAGAFAYEQSGNNATAAASAASSLAVVNGAGSATVATSIVNSPSGDGESAVMVMVTSNVNLTGFGRATEGSQASASGSGGSGAGATAGGAKAIPVSAVSYAEVHGGVSRPASSPCKAPASPNRAVSPPMPPPVRLHRTARSAPPAVRRSPRNRSTRSLRSRLPMARPFPPARPPARSSRTHRRRLIRLRKAMCFRAFPRLRP